eukprot:768692-Hanusia_phi.AAC.1
MVNPHVILQRPPVITNRLEVSKIPERGLEGSGVRDCRPGQEDDQQGMRSRTRRRKKRRKLRKENRAYAIFPEALEACVERDSLFHLALDDLKFVRRDIILHASLRRSPQRRQAVDGRIQDRVERLSASLLADVADILVLHLHLCLFHIPHRILVLLLLPQREDLPHRDDIERVHPHAVLDRSDVNFVEKGRPALVRPATRHHHRLLDTNVERVLPQALSLVSVKERRTRSSCSSAGSDCVPLMHFKSERMLLPTIRGRQERVGERREKQRESERRGRKEEWRREERKVKEGREESEGGVEEGREESEGGVEEGREESEGGVEEGREESEGGVEEGREESEGGEEWRREERRGKEEWRREELCGGEARGGAGPRNVRQ